MRYKKLTLLLVLIMGAFQLIAQQADEVDPMPIKLKAQVLNLADESPVPFAYILNFRTHMVVTANDQGS